MPFFRRSSSMAARKTLGESLGRGESLTPEKIDTFVATARSAIKGQRPLAGIAQATLNDAKNPDKAEGSEYNKSFQKPFSNVTKSKKKIGRPARAGEKLRVVSLRLPESLDDALTELARKREAR